MNNPLADAVAFEQVIAELRRAVVAVPSFWTLGELFTACLTEQGEYTSIGQFENDELAATLRIVREKWERYRADPRSERPPMRRY